MVITKTHICEHCTSNILPLVNRIFFPFIWKVGRDRHQLVYSENSCNNQGWDRSKLGAEDLSQTPICTVGHKVLAAQSA